LIQQLLANQDNKSSAGRPGLAAKRSRRQAMNIDQMQIQAEEQRTHLHETATELKAKVASVREQFDLAKNVRQHFAIACIATAAVTLLLGHAMGGFFVHR